ncbi:MAG: hypothetical protein A2086_13540 [Spirochaetes bacterium GWD1_27_9]|nr:MAG: hypothetical protein A2Z98_12855 [Spirochaetes bacterium GWB1_27_13]OHD23117.1 MAG: hypothetical protein A2Y34_17025 [Spirochaetes bacterium GWC1_27_15]OHD39929.1 MAG: hypothetical protein A2086_13540 [Spirochaetes bacterium GWD1_27_9]
MKIALLTNFITPYRLPLYKEISKRVEKLKIFLSTPMEDNRNWKPEWDDLDVTVQKNITIKKNWKHSHGFKDNLYIHIPYDTLFLLKKYKPDVIISSEMGARTIQASLYKIFNPKCKLIIWATLSEYSELGRGKLRGIIRKKLLPSADAFLANGQSGKRYINKFGIDDKKIFFAPYTTDIKEFLDIPQEKDEKTANTLLFVGQIVERKGLLQFFDVLKTWGDANPDKKVNFIIGGDGREKNTLENYSLPQNIKLEFLGNIDFKKLPEVYKRAGIFVFPSLLDEWGLVVNEALASGLPVLGSLYSQSVEELIQDGINGFTFHPDKKDEIYYALDKALSVDQQKLKEMRDKARKTIDFLTIEYVTDNIIKAIDFVTKK